MPFVETPRFPDKIAIDTQFGPQYSTAVGRNQGGYRFVNRNWSMPLYRGDISHAAKTQALLDDLLAFFHGVAGRFNGFRFKHFQDYKALAGQGTLQVITAGTTWQMYKTYTYAALSTVRKISKPVSGCVITGAGTYTYNTTTGVVTKLSGADPTGWTGEFDVPVAFDTDEMLPMGASIDIYTLPPMPIEELRL